MKSTFSKIVVKYGLISGGVIVIIPAITAFVLGTGSEAYAASEIIGYSTIILSLLVIFIATNDFQKQSTEPSSFTRLFGLGVGISAIAGVMFGLYNWLYVAYIHPEFMNEYFDYSIELIKSSGLSQLEIEQKIASLNEEKAMFMNPIVNFFVMFITVFMVGLMISVFAGLIMSRKNDSSEIATS